MASYVVGASVFLIATSYMIHFVVNPPGTAVANIDHTSVQDTSTNAVLVLVGTAGEPATWDKDVENVQRLGIIEDGSYLRIDQAKFEALARGRTTTQSTQNLAVDYMEARAALGIHDHEFRLLTAPLRSPGATPTYGLESDTNNYRVAYVGDFTGATPQLSAKSEGSALENLSVVFLNKTRALDPDGDVYGDDVTQVREMLLPLLGTTLTNTTLAPGTGPVKYQHGRVAPGVYGPLMPAQVTDKSMALAVTDGGGTLGYTKSREFRTVLGTFPTQGATGVTLSWREWVDTDRGNLSYDCSDFGQAELSPDGGVTWYPVRGTLPGEGPSRDCEDATLTPPALPHPANYQTRTFSDVLAFCAPCVNQPKVMLGFRWVADQDDTVGYGWIVDDVVVASTGGVLLRETFDDRQYNMVVIGTNADRAVLDHVDVKESLADFVTNHSGRILVLGPDPSIGWLSPLFAVGRRTVDPAPIETDATHPLVTLPSRLDVANYDHTAAWQFPTPGDADMFEAVIVNPPSSHILSVSREGAFARGSSIEGAIILAAFEPNLLKENETRRFFANTVAYGKYNDLYLELGPTAPPGVPVASAYRGGTVNMIKRGPANFTELSFTILTWRGTSAAVSVGGATHHPNSPTGVTVTASDGAATVSWTNATNWGSGTWDRFEVWRSTSPRGEAATLIGTTPYTTTTFADTGLTNGRTYHYHVIARSTAGAGPPSLPGSGTPYAPPDAPTGITGLELPGRVRLSWTAPTNTGPGTIFGYRVSASTAAGGPFAEVGQVGNTTGFDHIVGDSTLRYYRVEALNGNTWGATSSVAGPWKALVPASPPTVTVTNLTAGTLRPTWVAPSDLGGGVLAGYRVYRSTTETGTYAEITYVGNPLATFYDDAGHAPNTTRWYKVSAVTNLGEGLLSAAVSNRTAGVPYPPIQLPAGGPAPVTGTVTLAWQPPSHTDSAVTEYLVYRNGAHIKTVSTLGTTDIPGSGLHTYTIVARSAAGDSNPSNPVSVSS